MRRLVVVLAVLGCGGPTVSFATNGPAKVRKQDVTFDVAATAERTTTVALAVVAEHGYMPAFAQDGVVITEYLLTPGDTYVRLETYTDEISPDDNTIPESRRTKEVRRITRNTETILGGSARRHRVRVTIFDGRVTVGADCQAQDVETLQRWQGVGGQAPWDLCPAAEIDKFIDGVVHEIADEIRARLGEGK